MVTAKKFLKFLSNTLIFLGMVVYAQVQMLVIFSNIHDTVVHLIDINIFLVETDIYVQV